MGYSKISDYVRYESANVGDVRTIAHKIYYELDSPADFLSLVAAMPKKGRLNVIRVGNVYHYYYVQGVTLERLGEPMSGGKFQIEATLTLELCKSNPTIIDPWTLPPYNFRVSTVAQEESTGVFYPNAGDPLFNANDPNVEAPFVNTAGVFLEGVNTRGLTQISFSFNSQTFDVDNTWAAIGKTNAEVVTVCGIRFAERQLRLDSYNGEYVEETYSYDDNGVETTGTWRYYRIDVVLTADPQTFNRRFLNVGIHAITADGRLAKIWTWTLADANGTNVVYYGSYNDYLNSGSESGEELTENMFLNYYGTGLSGFDSFGRQIPTYRRGSLLIPTLFSKLGFPSAAPATN